MLKKVKKKLLYLYNNYSKIQKLIFLYSISIIIGFGLIIYVSINKQQQLSEEEQSKLVKESILKIKDNYSKTYSKNIEYKDSLNQILINQDKIKYINFVKNNSGSVNVFGEFNNGEKILINKVPYFSILSIENRLNPKVKYFWLEQEQKVSSIVLDMFMKVLPTFLILGIIIYLLYKQGLIGNSKDKYEVIKPNQIKGDINDLIGYKEIKLEFLQIKELFENKKQYLEYGIDKPMNIIMSGPAGTGKTKIAGYLSKELEIPIIYASAANLETGFVNGGVKTLENIYKTANKFERVIIFLDEAQGLLMKRGKTNGKFDDDTQNNFLKLLDGLSNKKSSEIIWILSSNFDETVMELDEAMSRRFPLKLHFRLPNKEERKKIFKLYLSKIDNKKISNDIDFEELSEMTTNLSPAIIETIVQKSSMISIRNNSKINMKNLQKAIELSTIGNTLKENKEKNIDSIAIHELGHFFCQYQILYEKYKNDYTIEDKLLNKIKSEISVIKISVETINKMNMKALGYVLNKENEEQLKSIKEYEEEIISLYGGVASEEVFKGKKNITTGCFNDIEKVSKILKHLYFDINIYNKNKINSNIVKDINKKELENEINKKAEELYNVSLKYINLNKNKIERIKKILIKEYVITKDEIFELIKLKEK